MVKCKNIIEFMEELAPSELAEEWDNVGLMVGEFDMPVKKAVTALDINDDVIDEAINIKADMIITHHPFIFGSVKNINSSDIVGKRAIKLIKNNIAVYSAHTNLDIAERGTNGVLAEILELQNIKPLMKSSDGVNGLGRIGELKQEISFIEFAISLKQKIGLKNLIVTGNREKIIKKIGLCTGQTAGSDYMVSAKENGCDAYITGDLRYHEAQFANNIDLCTVDITHYGGEVLVIPFLCDYLNKRAKENNLDFICVESKVNGQTLNII